MQASRERTLAALVAGRTSEPPEEVAGLADLARAHGLSAFVSRRAEEGAIELPEAVVAHLRRDAREAQRRSAVLDLELRRLAAGAPPGPPAIVLKGPAVARRYAHREERPYVDIDLLVPMSALGPWGSALRSAGYRGPTPWEERAARLGHHHLVFHRPGPLGRFPVELHWRLFAGAEARGGDYAALTAHAEESGELGGLLGLSPAAQVVALGVHLAHHSPDTRRLVWIRDFVELGEAGTIAAARAIAAELGLGWALEASLWDAQVVLDEPRWNAAAPELTGLAAARRAGAHGLRHVFATARELGPADGARYLLGRLDPRRFSGPGREIDWKGLRGWLGRRARKPPRDR